MAIIELKKPVNDSIDVQPMGANNAENLINVFRNAGLPYVMVNVRASENPETTSPVFSKEKDKNEQLQKNSQAFSAVYTEKGIESLIKGRNSIFCDKKHTIYKDGHSPNFLYYILKGKVRTFKTHEDGKKFVVGLYDKGDFLGHIAIFGEVQYGETAEAMQPTELVAIPKKDFETIVQNDICVARKFIKMLAKSLGDQNTNIAGIAYNSLRQKVSYALISIEKKYHTNSKEHFFIDITREELACLAGTAKESLTRVLAEFKEERLIDVRKDRKIEVIDLKKLEHILG